VLFLDYFWLELKQQVVYVSQGSLLKRTGEMLRLELLLESNLEFSFFLSSHIVISICHIVNLLEPVLVNLFREMLVFQIYTSLI